MNHHDYMMANRARWDEMVAVHEKSAFYNVVGFKAGRISVTHLERAEIGDVSGKSLLHLQCHFGMDTMSWARLGATVTGVDYSEQAITLARSLAHELHIDARFVHANIYDLPDDALIPDKFDIIYTALGVLGWLPDLKAWGKIVAHYLKPGGTFYLLESHPFMHTLQEDDTNLRVTYPYFAPEALGYEGDHSYADSETVLEHKAAYNWNHSFAEIINALISEGLALEFLHEFSFCGWSYFSDMEKVQLEGDVWYQLKEQRKREMVPLMFSLKAVKR